MEIETLLKSGGLLVALGLVPLLVGLLYTARDKENGILASWGSGFIMCMGIFQVLVIPCIFMEKSLTFLSIGYAIILSVCCVLSVVFNAKRAKDIWLQTENRLKNISWITVVTVVVILFQAYMYVAYMHIDDDDAFYVATANTTVYEDSLFQVNPYTGEAYKAFPSRYVLSPFPVFIAFLGKISGIHTTILAHTVLPAVLLVLAYVVFTMIGNELFRRDSQKTACFVLMTALLQMFASSTVYTQGSFMLIRIWQGKAVLAAVLLPFLFWVGLRMQKEKWKGRDWFFLVGLMFACCMVSSMGIALGAILAGMIGILMSILKKDIKLVVKMCMCVIPNIVYALIYLVVL